MNRQRWITIPTGVALLAVLVSGCFESKRSLRYIGDKPLQYYKDTATSIAYPQVYHETEEDLLYSDSPRTIRSLEEAEIRDMTLVEAIHLALANSKIIRTNAEFLSPGNRLLNNADQATSIYDSAIQETEVFNGIGVQGSRRGLEDALSDFDARVSWDMNWRQNERISNNTFTTQGSQPGTTFREETSVFNSRIEKQLATGAIMALNHNWNFTSNNAPANTRLFGSFYDGTFEAEFRQPLWAGWGTEYTRIAGPIGTQRGNVNGVNRGVMIARIGQDITQADFELQVHNLLRDVEELYWDLSLAYRTYHSEVVARNSAEKIFRNVDARLGLTGFSKAEKMQALDSLYDGEARVKSAQGDLLSAEGRLRRLLSLPVNDGTVIRPVDEPVSTEFLPDWHMALAEGLTRRVELRKQKWKIKELELQHKAAKSLVNPRLDFVSEYRVNGFGHNLFGDEDRDGVTTQGVKSAYETLTQGDQTGWETRLEFSMALGARQANSQVRNIELRLAKARKALSMQEHEISHELASVFRDLDRFYLTSELYYNRRDAAAQQVAALEVNVDRDPQLVDRLLRAQVSLAQADVSYYQSLLQYNKSIADYHLRKGTILDRNNVILSEGVWDADAYQDALRRAWERSHAFDVEKVYTKPGEFVLGYMEDHLGDRIQQMHLEEPSLPPSPKPVPDPINAVKMNAPKNTEYDLPKLPKSVPASPRSSQSIIPVDGLETQFEVEAEKERLAPNQSEPDTSGRVENAWWLQQDFPVKVEPKSESPKQEKTRSSAVLRIENLHKPTAMPEITVKDDAKPRETKTPFWFGDRQPETDSKKPSIPNVESGTDLKKKVVNRQPVVRRIEKLDVRSPFSRKTDPQPGPSSVPKARPVLSMREFPKLQNIRKPASPVVPDMPVMKKLPEKRILKQKKRSDWKSANENENQWQDSFKSSRGGDGFEASSR